ncbi:SRPBCC domain-containing protein [Ensifer adhaerens]|uniref:SRPBCC family protein n=1 Tax=Ensifer adhaerens TaxID=106592 RepID=UPI001CBBF312|nr:SRPBCC domain-containing protein [Ensifer adhaerens]MBZ7924621.1 SRPBCC domain-containing protein [Ensifer adhaerens]UAX96147.1 SRPBCC domain-containing protein [Ensifer adhaerens]UAY04511.1 SRPBCC domain-containing protein [Ensifer adhaerens]UAY09943.1 SRPBCC domain-containing protein [Ensifer adhaerens]
MIETTETTRSVVVERNFSHPPEKIWRALTQPHLIAEWLMRNDFVPEVGRRFTLSADWGQVDCEVQTIEANRSLAYRWDTKDLTSVVTWTLAPANGGTSLRMEQRGFRADQKSYFQGATVGWQRFFTQLEEVVAKLD